jgi:type II secretory pathway component PulC
MRLMLVAALAACGPAVAPKPVVFDEDLPKTAAPEVAPAEAAAAAPVENRPVAAPGKGLRTGTISRERLVEVLNAGPAHLFHDQIEITAKLDNERFVGWQLVQFLDVASPLHDADFVPGDVVLSVNGKPFSRPDQLWTIWESLRTANEVTAQVWRGNAQLTLAFAIEPKL